MMTTSEKSTSRKAPASTASTGNPQSWTVRKQETAASATALSAPRLTSVMREPVPRKLASTLRAGLKTSTVATISCTKPRM